MDDDINIEVRLSAMRQVVAFLLAREAVRYGGDLTQIHAAFIQHIVSACSDIPATKDERGQLEAAMSSELDSLFGLAEIFRRVMPDK